MKEKRDTKASVSRFFGCYVLVERELLAEAPFPNIRKTAFFNAG